MAVFSLFRLDILSLIKTEASLSKNFHIAPSEVERMPVWQYELFIKYINEAVTEENKQAEGQMDEYNVKDTMKNTSKMMSDPSRMMPKMPSMNMPSMGVPKF